MAIIKHHYSIEYEITSDDPDRISFSFDFPVASADDIGCYDITPENDGDDAIAEIPASQFAVSESPIGLDVGGSVTLSSPLAVGHCLRIERATPVDQERQFANQTYMPPEEVTRGLDKLTMIAQEHEGLLGKGEEGLQLLSEGLAEEVNKRAEADASLTQGVEQAQATAASAIAVANGKADKDHTHTITQIPGLSTHLNNKMPKAPTDGKRYEAMGEGWVEAQGGGAHAASHLIGGSDAIPEATPSRGGLMSPEYAAKLDGLFPTGAQNFYVDPDGDTSINTPGTVDAPFKSPRIALDILSSRQLSSPYDITINVRPGNYGSENADFGSHIFSEKGLIIRGVDSNNLQPPDSVDPDTLPKWNINTNLAFSGPQIVSIRDLDITLAQTVAINRTASLNLQRTIRFTKTNADNNNFLSAGDYGCIFISGNLTVDFNNTSALAFATAWYYSRITFEAQTKLHTLNLTSTVRTLSAERYSEIFFNNGTTWTYDSPVGYTGFKYQIYFWTFLRLNGLGVNFIPGAIAGTAEETCLLWT